MKKILLYCSLLCAVSMQAQDLLPYPIDTVDGKEYYRYTVEKSIGLYRISKNFGVSQEDILKANPDLRNRGLTFEEVILIPTNREVVERTEQVAIVQQPLSPEEPVEPVEQTESPQPVETVETVEVAETIAPLEPVDSVESVEASAETVVADDVLQTVDTMPVIAYTDTIRLVYMLPLSADVSQRNPTMDRFYDFYAGALLALKHHDPRWIDSLGTAHATFYEVRTYDIGKLGSEVTQLADSGVLAGADAILGPAYFKPVEALSDYALEHKIPVIIPFLPSVPTNAGTNPYMLKFNPSEQIHTHVLMEYLDTLRATTNIVLVDAYAKKMDYSDGIRSLRDSIKARRFSTTSTSIRQILADSVGAALKDSVENILLFHSERYSNVQLLMPYLMSGRRGKKLTLLSQYAWQNERIILPQLFTTVFRSPNSEEAARYEQDFAQYFGHRLSSTLPRYDLLGYDLTRYMVEALRDGTFHVSDSLYEGLQSSILFEQTDNGGFENTHIVIERR